MDKPSISHSAPVRISQPENLPNFCRNSCLCWLCEHSYWHSGMRAWEWGHGNSVWIASSVCHPNVFIQTRRLCACLCHSQIPRLYLTLLIQDLRIWKCTAEKSQTKATTVIMQRSAQCLYSACLSLSVTLWQPSGDACLCQRQMPHLNTSHTPSSKTSIETSVLYFVKNYRLSVDEEICIWISINFFCIT